MAWSNAPGGSRRSPLPPHWGQLRAVVFQRDGYQCTATTLQGERCPDAATDCDHIGTHDDHRLVNLRSLCHRHHALVTGRQAAAARPRRNRPKEQHPSAG